MPTSYSGKTFVFQAFTVMLALGLNAATTGCGGVECGKGTVEKDGVCVVESALECGVGFKALGNKCVPEAEWIKTYCGENAEYDPITDTCKGTGGGTTVSCPETCPAPSGGTICLSGRVFQAPELLAKWAGDANYNEPTPITTADKAVIKIYDPIAFVSNPSASEPIAEVGIDDNGCWIAKNVKIPFTNLFAIAVDDQSASVDNWALAGTGETPVAGQNSEGLEIPAVSMQVANDWGNNLLTDGSMIAIYRDVNKKGVEDVVPTFDGKAPKDGKFEGTSMDVFFFAADPSDPKATIDTSATKTTKSGVVAVRKAEVKAFSGDKAGCTIESGLGGSTPNVLFFRFYDVTGC